MIWKYSFGGPKIFRLVPRTDELVTWTPMVINHKPPSSRAACRESLQLSQQCGQFFFGARGLSVKSLWFRSSEDILYCDHTMSGHLELEGYCTHRELTKIENVAINWRGTSNTSNLCSVEEILDNFPNCKRILLVMSYGPPLHKGDIEFLRIEEDDKRAVCVYKGRDMDCAGLKQALEEDLWEQDSDSSSEECKIPCFEAFEAVPRRTVSKSA